MNESGKKMHWTNMEVFKPIYYKTCFLIFHTLIYFDFRDAPPIIPTDTNQGYKQMKAKIGSSKVRPWKWMPFTNPARKVC